jgi:hypothetical protein
VSYVVWSKSEYVELSASLGVFLQLFAASYMGTDIPQLRKFARDRHHAKGTLHHVRDHVGEVLGSSGAKKWMNHQAANMLFCNSCFKPESENQDGKMQVCISCKKFGREIRYCNKYVKKPSESYALLSSHLLNRDCQRANWKEHKRECGKEFGTLAAHFFVICLIIWHSDFGSLQDDVSPITLGQTISLRLDIPPVAPGYRRTPYLLRLMSCLNRLPTADVSIDNMPFNVMISHGCHST